MLIWNISQVKAFLKGECQTLGGKGRWVRNALADGGLAIVIGGKVRQTFGGSDLDDFGPYYCPRPDSD